MSEYMGVASTGPSAAFFDLDRTLIAGSSAFTLAAAARSAGLLANSAFVRAGLAATLFKFFGSKDDTTEAARQQVLSFVAGQRQDDLTALNEHVLPILLNRIRPEARRLLDLHRQAGRSTFIVSAAPQEIVGPLALSLGMTGGIGTRAEVNDGIYTGVLTGPFCYGQGKVAAIAELARWDGLDLSQCYAYSDSASDLPMLEAVGHPVVVNPDKQLERHARRHGWPVVHFRQQTKQVARRTIAGLSTTAIAAASFAIGARVGATRRRSGRWLRPSA
jgi:HAD superfamily hydrolase (TIGR01490 family)